jgi:hypothetical protein
MAKPKIEAPMTPQMTPIQSMAGTPTPAGQGVSSTVGSNGMMGSVPRTTISPLQGMSTMIWFCEASFLCYWIRSRKVLRYTLLLSFVHLYVLFLFLLRSAARFDRTRWSWLINKTGWDGKWWRCNSDTHLGSKGKYPERGGFIFCRRDRLVEGSSGAPGITSLMILCIRLVDMVGMAAGDDLWIEKVLRQAHRYCACC